jgi:hypothetical protein
MITQTETVVMLSACALRLRADTEGKSVGMIHQAPGAPTEDGPAIFRGTDLAGIFRFFDALSRLFPR